jgi:hypothetical protein
VNRDAARDELETWIGVELVSYAEQKWDGGDERHTTWTQDNAEWWEDFVYQYVHRARTLGYTSPLGQQALLKGLVTLFEMCVTMCLGSESLPSPGHPSGTIIELQQ